MKKVSYSCGSLGEVDSRLRKEPVQRPKGRCLPNAFREQEGGPVTDAELRGNYMEWLELKMNVCILK